MLSMAQPSCSDVVGEAVVFASAVLRQEEWSCSLISRKSDAMKRDKVSPCVGNQRSGRLRWSSLVPNENTLEADGLCPIAQGQQPEHPLLRQISTQAFLFQLHPTLSLPVRRRRAARPGQDTPLVAASLQETRTDALSTHGQHYGTRG